MTVKLHLHSGNEVPHLGITPDMELGHLYSDTGNLPELHEAAARLGLKYEWFQRDELLPHYDLWKVPLRKAKGLFQTVSDLEFTQDIVRLNSGPGD